MVSRLFLDLFCFNSDQDAYNNNGNKQLSKF
jgi:hypothetical protein